MRIIPIAGTHGWDGQVGDWLAPDSDLMIFLASRGIEPLDSRRPFIWDTNLGGVGFGGRDLLGWKASGINLLYYAVPPRCPERRVPGPETVVLTHSHGLQVALYAAAQGLKIDRLVDICGPVRKDMLPIARLAKLHIRHWTHVHAGRRDRMQWLGELFDGTLGVVREHPLADRNVAVSEADHGSLLRDSAYFEILVGLLTGD